MFCNLQRERKSCSTCVTFILLHQYILSICAFSLFNSREMADLCYLFLLLCSHIQNSGRVDKKESWEQAMDYHDSYMWPLKVIKRMADGWNMQGMATLMATCLKIILSVMVALKKVWTAFSHMIYAHSSSKGQSAQFQSLLTFWVIIGALYLCKGGSQAGLGHYTRISHHHQGAVFFFLIIT